MDKNCLKEQLKDLNSNYQFYKRIIDKNINGLFKNLGLTSFYDIVNNLLDNINVSIEIMDDGSDSLTDNELKELINHGLERITDQEVTNSINSLKTYFSLIKNFDIFIGELLSDGYLPKSETMNKKQYGHLSIDQYIELLKILKE